MTKQAVQTSKTPSVPVASWKPVLKEYRQLKHELTLFMNAVSLWFSSHPEMALKDPPIIHSVKSRLKDEVHLREKIARKYMDGEQINFVPENLGSVVTDLSGVRVIHLHQKQFEVIHRYLSAKLDTGDWFLEDYAKAFTWDPESEKYFKSLGLQTELRESFYTSVHYTLRPKAGSKLVCEVQIRTLFEEIWGEVDHTLNYPKQTLNKSCKEQLRVLAKLVGAGSRLVDSIFSTR